MSKFKKYDVAGLLGFTPISKVSDAEIWSALLTPNVRSLVGDIVKIDEPRVLETQLGLFPGDEVSNLNDHRLFGGQTGFVRFPYITTLVHTTYGAVAIKRDATKIKALAYYGDTSRGKGQLIYKAALRDRRYDGTLRTNDTPLLDFPFDDANLNRPLPVGRGVELSIYGFLPGSRISEAMGDFEYEDFVANPFGFLDRPELFLQFFQRAWRAARAPGQVSAPIPDISKVIPPKFEAVARKAGYDFIENASSHYHVAMWARAIGYRYAYQKDADTLAALTAGVDKVKASGIKLNRVQESWLCVLQSLRPIELIPAGLYFGGVQWPQNNIDQANLWMYKPLHEKAAKLLTGPVA